MYQALKQKACKGFQQKNFCDNKIINRAKIYWTKKRKRGQRDREKERKRERKKEREREREQKIECSIIRTDPE